MSRTIQELLNDKGLSGPVSGWKLAADSPQQRNLLEVDIHEDRTLYEGPEINTQLLNHALTRMRSMP